MKYQYLYDSTTPAEIPTGVYVAAYANGLYAWSAAEKDRFPGRLIQISVLSGHPEAGRDCRILDVETGDATPADVAPFIRYRDDLGHHNTTIYCSRETEPAVREAAGRLPWRLWIATLDGDKLSPGAYPNLWAVQFASPPQTHGHYDLSIMYGTW